MAPPQLDQVAIDVAASAPPHDAVTFRGYLGAGPDPNIFRLFIRPSFDRWLELNVNDILAQVVGSDETWGESLVWVRRDAQITTCFAASAVEIAALELNADDPGATYHPRR